MSAPSNPAGYALGRLAAAWQEGMQQLAESIAQGAADYRAGRPRPPLTPEQREARREAAYRRRIAAERDLAHRTLQRQVAAIRADLGLPDTAPKIGDQHR